ncbi:hypothetical protein [Aquitalea sp. ASV11]|uniref:hypothetical protein n=1 Tax=Aquitalea sp. ASV11 TaxID=2795103 RepID=UPI0018EDF396|nr:hypothetical protein [Aquitalea sp. ASV11]
MKLFAEVVGWLAALGILLAGGMWKVHASGWSWANLLVGGMAAVLLVLVGIACLGVLVDVLRRLG